MRVCSYIVNCQYTAWASVIHTGSRILNPDICMTLCKVNIQMDYQVY